MINLTIKEKETIKQLFEDNANNLQQDKFDDLYLNCPIALRGKLTSLLYSIEVYPLHDLTLVPNYFCSSVEYPGSNNILIIPENIKSIGMKAFYNCSGLKKVIINNSGRIGRIGMRCFSSCEDLEEVTINIGTRFIGDVAFEGCTNLKSVILSSSITYIGENAFYGCNSLNVIRYDSTMENWSKIKIVDIIGKNEKLKELKIQCTDGVLQFDGEHWIQ